MMAAGKLWKPHRSGKLARNPQPLSTSRDKRLMTNFGNPTQEVTSKESSVFCHVMFTWNNENATGQNRKGK
tara:strand:+ start:2025 stop:2237 length:213 start_codon:yes stop_codon:yes gene_type:complete